MSYCSGSCEHLNEKRHRCEKTGEKLTWVRGWWGVTHEHRGIQECDEESQEE